MATLRGSLTDIALVPRRVMTEESIAEAMNIRVAKAMLNPAAKVPWAPDMPMRCARRSTTMFYVGAHARDVLGASGRGAANPVRLLPVGTA